MTTQPDWRFCVQCAVLYFDGHQDGNKGDCKGAPAGQRGHRPAGYNFVLPFNTAPTAHAQDKWRNCWKCQAMYFDGHTDGNKGRCPSGGGHEGHGDAPTTWNFVLPHNVAATPTTQDKWRNCWKCQAMYFDGSSDKGRCAAGEGHEGHGNEPATWNFVLPHPVSPKVIILTPNLAHVRIIGERFTPSGSVHFGIGYHDGISTHTREATATADFVTGRVETEFEMTSARWAWISTHATDKITGTAVDTRIE
ncbi:hypothetical protein [Nocardia aurea]|uniref:Uncharacterized protein n=1 Tax=Nocardia aurea TaxID=2144174 RepID=A0ABV3G5D1_9NOCA